MILMTLVFDIAPLGGGFGISLGIIFFLVFAAIAFVMYKILKRTVKMAIRMTIVAAILLIALVGGIGLYLFGAPMFGTPDRPVRPTPIPRNTR